MTTTTTPERPHHPCGPSSLYRRQQCPGSYWMEQGQPELPSADADHGTLMHNAVWDKALRADLSATDLKHLELIDDTLLHLSEGQPWRVEERLELDDADGNLLYYGYADGICFPRAGVAVIAEFKFGYNAVEDPGENLQFASLAAALMFAVESLEEVRGVLIQPTVNPAIRQHTFTNFPGLFASLSEVVKTATSPDKMTLAMGDHCRYCRAKGICPQFIRQANALVATAERQELGLIGDIGRVYRKAMLVEKLIAETKAACRAQVEQAGGTVGVTGTGLRIVEKPGDRTVDLAGAWKKLQGIITSEDMLTCCKASAPALEKILAERLVERGVIKKKAQAKKWMEENLPISRGEPKRTLETF